ncbi:MAG: homoserine kinase [Gammaproteobacteria bacterium]|nr:homoserine kinase [Gammaproteobacteria bacterium]
MAKYTQLQRHDIERIAKNYNLTVTEFESIEGGAGNSSYLLYTGHCKYVLTVCDDKALPDAIRMGQLLLWLEQYNFPATRLLPSVSGDIVIVYMDKPVMLKVYIEGQVNENLDDVMLFQTGAEMAKLHQIPAPDYLPEKHAYGLQTFSNIITGSINTEYESWLAKQLDHIKQNIPLDLPCGLIHGDVFFDNVLFEGDKFKAIIDFEEACHYYKGFDLGMGITGMCVTDTTVALDKVRALVSGYQKIRILGQAERESLQLFIHYAATATSCWRFWKYHIDTPSADKADKHRHMMQIAEGISSIPKATFQDAVFS